MKNNGIYKGIKYWINNLCEVQIEAQERKYIERHIDSLPFNEYMTLRVNQELKEGYNANKYRRLINA